jgi:hypothetical protein
MIEFIAELFVAQLFGGEQLSELGITYRKKVMAGISGTVAISLPETGGRRRPKERKSFVWQIWPSNIFLHSLKKVIKVTDRNHLLEQTTLSSFMRQDECLNFSSFAESLCFCSLS